MVAFGKIATLTSLDFSYADIGAEGAWFSSLAQDWNRILQHLFLLRKD
jgi:hypothetical protein